ncbi:uncharacterized protein C2845_PM05G29240 [Panicum miliaceum]|uniref:Uncharacterized protein n=1 Tax=Panicum miliaceum TaxID=4540 RepID=A0A3L6SWV1_PANMI|nr:uncharacterized protein C2845_PM05G29240 [Panicum miliaceum]
MAPVGVQVESAVSAQPRRQARGQPDACLVGASEAAEDGGGAAAQLPRSQPRYPDLCGRRWLQLKVQILNREVGFLEVRGKEIYRIEISNSFLWLKRAKVAKLRQEGSSKYKIELSIGYGSLLTALTPTITFVMSGSFFAKANEPPQATQPYTHAALAR